MSFRSVARRIWYASGLRDARLWVRYAQTNAQWKTLRAQADAGQRPPRVPGTSTVALIIPPDPLLLTASKGDEAMIACVVESIRRDHPSARIVVATSGDVADTKALAKGLEPCRMLDDRLLRDSARMLAELAPTHVFTIGADVLDGSYDPNFSLRLLALTDLAARAGVLCRVTGFSFSLKPYPALAEAFASASDRIVFRLRDPRSFERFRAFCPARAELVADVAFLLEPDSLSARTSDVRRWIERRRAVGQKVLGLNFHPLLLPAVRRDELPELVTSLADSMAGLLAHTPCSVILLAHDFRGSSADHHCLIPLYERLRVTSPDQVLYPDEEFSAAELKGLLGSLDGVISGRMHLSIASLGMGTPVFAFSYKDKIEGLLMHFALGEELAVTADVVQDPSRFEQQLAHFVGELGELSRRLDERLPIVKALASRNLAPPADSSKA